MLNEQNSKSWRSFISFYCACLYLVECQCPGPWQIQQQVDVFKRITPCIAIFSFIGSVLILFSCICVHIFRILDWKCPISAAVYIYNIPSTCLGCGQVSIKLTNKNYGPFLFSFFLYIDTDRPVEKLGFPAFIYLKYMDWPRIHIA